MANTFNLIFSVVDMKTEPDPFVAPGTSDIILQKMLKE